MVAPALVAGVRGRSDGRNSIAIAHGETIGIIKITDGGFTSYGEDIQEELLAGNILGIVDVLADLWRIGSGVKCRTVVIVVAQIFVENQQDFFYLAIGNIVASRKVIKSSNHGKFTFRI